MARQAHDLGYRKWLKGQIAKPRLVLAWERAKRRHPGPLPNNWRNFSEWKAAGKPSWKRGS